MAPTGRLVTIKRSGVDGPHFPLSLSTCLFGRGIECDIRIQLPVVSKLHCKIEINGQEAILFNFSSANPTQVNGSAIDKPVQLKHGDVITIVDRSFRYENESHQNGSKSPGFPGQRHKQESQHRVSRSSLSSNPDGKVQDSNARSKPSEENVSGRPQKKGEAASPISGGSEEPAASRTLPVAHPSEVAGRNYRNAPEPTGGDFQEDSSGSFVSCRGGLGSLPCARGLENGASCESPFKKLYDSMKEELDVKSEKGDVLQSGKKSGSQGHRAPEKECSGGLQAGTHVPVSPKSRPRSGRGTHVKADPALEEQGISQTEDRRGGEEAVETPKDTRGPVVPPEETTKPKTPVQRSPQTPSRKRQHQDVGDTSGRASADRGPKEGFGAGSKSLTPRKSLTRNQTPAQVESAADFGDTPEKRFSRKRKSIPTSVDVLTPETEAQNPAILAPLPVQVERKVPNSSIHQPEKGGAAPGCTHSGLPGHSSVDPSNFGESISKAEGTPLKRRRVSFGGRLKPELFDENLPPNTPLKRGETPRRSLVSHTPPVLKKIIKERPQPSGREDSSGLRPEVTTQPQLAGSPARDPTGTPPGASDPRRGSPKASSVSSGGKSPHQADVPKRGGRRSGNLLSKRASVDRSQHEILQMIFSKRRSGASEANLIVAKSWADVVKLGAKQTQAKAVKHGPQRQLSRRPRKANTPKKPVSGIPNQFSTGHANSPCTIIIGKAHLEKVNVPARPYRMLNDFVINKKMDFSEDLSGLTEMFRTPAAKVKPQTESLCPSAFSHSEDVRREFQVPDSGEKPLLRTSENFGEKVFPEAQNAPQEPFDQSPASPVLRRQSIRANVNIEKTPASEAEAPKAASSANRLRRSVGPSSTQKPGAGRKDEEAQGDPEENASGRHLTKTPKRGQNPEGAARAQEGCAGVREQDAGSEETSEGAVAVRRSRRYSEQKQEPVADLTSLKRWQDTESKEDRGSIQGLLRTPIHAQGPKDAEDRMTEKRQKSSKAELGGTPARMSVRLKAPPQRADLEEGPSALRKPTQVPAESPRSHGEQGGGDEDIGLFNRTPEQKLNAAENVTGSRRWPRTPKTNIHPLEDPAGLRDLFQTPNHTDKPTTGDQNTKVPCKSPLAGPGNTPASKKRWLETPPQKVDVEEEPSALRKPTQTPGERPHSHREPGGEDEDIRLFNKTPEQKPAENVSGSKRRPRTPKRNVQSLEDLAGVKELFQTPDLVTGDHTTKVSCKSPLAEPVNTPMNRNRRLKTPQKVGLEEEPSALRKPTQTPAESPHSHREPGGGDEDIRLFNKTPEQKLNRGVTGSKRKPRTPRKSVQSLEDLVGLKELFQTPNHTDKPVTDDKTTKAPCKSSVAKLVNTPVSQRRLSKTPSQKVNLEKESFALRTSTLMLEESPHEHREPAGGDEGIGLLKETPKQKLDPAENVTGSRRQPRTPKTKVHSLEDLAGLRELFQSPDHTDKPMTGDQTTKAPCKSPLAGPGNTPASRKRQLKTPPQKVNLEKESFALRTSTLMLEESPHEHREPAGGDEGIGLLKETPKQKLDPAENVSGSKRRPRTPKTKVHSLEDLAGLRELFQSPDHTDKPMTGDQTTKAPCKSPLAGPGNTPASRKRQLKTPPQKVNLEKESFALRTSMLMLEESPHEHREPAGGDEGIGLLKETPQQKLDPAENVSGSKRRPRTPKTKVLSLEDLAGLKELFQTPDPVTGDHTTKVSCKSPLAEPVNTPARKKRWLETPPQKVDLAEEPSALRKPTQTPGENTHSHTEPVGNDKDITLFKKIPKQKLDPVENVSASKRLRTGKEKVEFLEDMAGFKELFQTPEQTKRTTAVVKTAILPCKSPRAETVNTATHTKTLLKVSLGKVTIEKELSALTKPTQRPEEATHTHREPVGEDEDIKLFMDTPKQKLKPAENISGSKRRPRTPKTKVLSLEDLAGLKELLQTPDPETGDHTTKVSCKSPLAEPVNTPARKKRQFETPPQKEDLEEGPSALRKPTQTPGGSAHSHGEPVGEGEDIKLFTETPKQKLDPAENVTGSRRQPRTPKKKVHSLEDLAGLRELFQSPDHTDKPMTGDQTTKAPCKSPLAGPGNTPASRKRQLKTAHQKVDLEGEPSALRKPTQTPGENTHSHGEPVDEDGDIKLFKDTPKQKLNAAENVTGSKKCPRTPREKVQSLEDLVGLKELFQSPHHTDKLITGDQATKVPCKSPLAGPGNKPTNRRRRLRTPPQKVGLEEEPSALRKPTQTPGEGPHSHGEPEGGGEDIRLFKETPEEKLGPGGNVTRSKRRLRTPKKKVQALEDPAGLKELFPIPNHTDKPMTGDQTKAPCTSPLAGPDNKPTNRRRRLRTPPQKVGLEEEPSALRKPTQTPGEGPHSHGKPIGGGEDIRLFKETPEEKLGPGGNVTRSKRRLRTPKKKVQALEDPAGLKELFPIPNHTDKPMTGDQTTKAPCTSPLAGPDNKPTNRRRRLRTPPQKVELKEEPSALRKPTQTPEENTHSLRESGDDKDMKLFNRTARQKLGPTENVTGRKYRLRAPKEKAQPLEDTASLTEPIPTPDHTKEQEGKAGGMKGAPQQIPDGGKPVKILPGVLRAPRAQPAEDQAGLRDPVQSQSESSISLSPKRKRGNKGRVTGTKRVRSVSPVQAPAEEKPPQKKRRGAPREGCDPTGPLPTKKKLRIVGEGMELLEDLTSHKRETRRRGRDVERTPAQQGMSLRSRRPNKPELEEHRPEPVKAAAEKVKTKRNDRKPLTTSRETKPQSPEDRAKNPTPQGQVRASRMCLRSARQTKMPLPDGAEERRRGKGVAVCVKNHEEERTQRSDFVSLRSRNITIPPGGNASESESQQRVTRGAKRCAENIKKDEDNVNIKKIRTRSRRDN